MLKRLFFKAMMISIITFLACKTTDEIVVGNGIESITHFGVCYAKVTQEDVQGYDLVIIEPDFYSKMEIESLQAKGTKIIAYITLGEIDSNRWYYPKLEERGFLGKNENWNSSFLNLEDSFTRSVILNEVLTEITAKGVDGIFMDTIDAVSPYAKNSHLEPYMLELIREIRNRNPELILIQNSGLFLLEESKDYVDGVLIEDIASGYDFENQEYFIKSVEAYHERSNLVRSYSDKFNLPFFIVDFAIEPSSIKEVESRLDVLNLPYFISNIQLNKLPVLTTTRS